MGERFTTNWLLIGFLTIALVAVAFTIVCLAAAKHPERYCIEGYEYRYAGEKGFYVATRNPPLTCLLPEKNHE